MKFSQKYDYWIRSSKFSAITKVFSLVCNLLIFTILARTLGRTEYGVWGLFTTISATLFTARTSLIRNGFIRFMNQTGKDENKHLQASAFVLSLSITIFFAIIFLIFAPTIADLLNAPGLEVMLRWYAFTMFLTTISSQSEMSLTAHLQFKYVTYMYLLRQTFLVSVIALYWAFDLKLTPAILSIIYMCSIAVGMVAGFIFSRNILRLSFQNYRKWLPQLWGFGKFVFGTNVSAQLFRSADGFITSALISPAVSGLYNASNRISNLVDMPSNVLADVAFAKAVRIDNKNSAAVKNMYEKTTGAIIVFSIPALVFVLLFAEYILYFLAGPAFVDAAPILRITAFFGFILPFLKQYGTIMDATGYPNINFQTNLLSCVLNIIFNVIGIHFLGFLGAAIGTATTYFITFCVTQRILNKKFGISFFQVLRNTWTFYELIFSSGKKYLSTFSLVKKTKLM